jgi:competence protein ComEC
MEFSVALLAGVIGTLVLPAVAPIWVVASIGGILLALALVGAIPIALPALRIRVQFWRSFPYRASLTPVLCGVAVGFLHTSIQAHLYLSERWPAQRDGDRVIATAIIDTIPVVRGDSHSFDAIATLDAPVRTSNGLRIRITSRAPELTPHVGDRWRLLMTLRPPRARVNPGASDLERMLFHDRVHALGTVISATINHRLDGGHRPLDELRERIARHIDARVADRDAAALIAALAVGVTGAMSREQWRVFNATGTTHLVAISGLHVTLFAVIAFAAARAAWSALLYRFVAWPRETFGAVVGFASAAVYATLAGLSVPTERTLIMLGVWLFMRCFARATPPFHSFALALSAVLILDPFAPLTPGFWLSFGAMAAIILTTSTHFTRQTGPREALKVQAVVTIALIPMTLASFGSVSLIGPLVNLIAIPAMSWVFVPTILLSIVLAPLSAAASDAVLRLSAWMHETAWPWLAAAADFPWALVHASPPLWWYGIAAVSVLISLMPLPVTLRLASLIWMLPLAVCVDAAPTEGAADLTILDVGQGNMSQGTSVVVQTAHHVVVYDTGDVYGSDGRTAETVLIPYLHSRGVHRIDTLILSRLSAANAPGVTALLAELPIDAAWVGSQWSPDFPGAQACREGVSWEWDGVFFATHASSTAECTLTIETRSRRAPSDITHWVVVSGRRERSGREKATVRHGRNVGATVLATADLGAIRFRFDPAKALEGPWVERADGRTVWRSSP